MPFSISTVRCVGLPSSSMLSEPRRSGIVPSSTTVTPRDATRSPMRPANALEPLRLKSPSSPCPTASCSSTPGQPGPSTTVITPAGAGRAFKLASAWSTALCAYSARRSSSKNDRPWRPPPPENALLAPAVFFDDDRDRELHQRPHVRGQHAVTCAPPARRRTRRRALAMTCLTTRGSRARASCSICSSSADLRGGIQRRDRIVHSP